MMEVQNGLLNSAYGWTRDQTCPLEPAAFFVIFLCDVFVLLPFLFAIFAMHSVWCLGEGLGSFSPHREHTLEMTLLLLYILGIAIDVGIHLR